MVNEINSGGVPPLGPVTGGQGQGDPETSGAAPTGQASAAGGRSVIDQIQSKAEVPPQLAVLVDADLTTEGAKQGAADLSSALRYIGISIANVDPSSLPGLAPQ